MPARPSARQRGYSWRWDIAAKRYRSLNPICVMCLKKGKIAQADVVDHITPHKGDQELMWSQANWQSLCYPCHNSDKQRIDKGGKPRQTIGPDGWPVDD
jgi:5-methylcytosine-specific restriction protein A